MWNLFGIVLLYIGKFVNFACINLILMKLNRIVSAVVAMMFIAMPMIAQNASEESVGLVLSGGGAKGIAHIGVIKALEENDIPIDFVTGTSMGAIVGGLYACGYTPDEMMELIKSRYFNYMATGSIDPSLAYYFSNPRPSPQLYSFQLGKKDSQRFDPQSLIAPSPLAFGFMEIFSAYSGQCGEDFDKLFVPYRCVTSDIYGQRPMVLRSGNLGDAVRASMSFPLVFQASKVNGAVCYDGGIFDNFPVGVMTEDFAPDVMLGVNVGSSDKGPANSLLDQISLLVTRPQSLAMPEKTGIYMRVNLDEFELLDFEKADAIYEVGYQHAMAMMDSLKERIHRREPAQTRKLRRDIFKSKTPYLRFNHVNVNGGTEKQDRYLEYLFHAKRGTDTIGIDHARSAYYRALSSKKIENMTPRAHLSPDGSGYFTMNIDANIKNPFELGVGGYLTSSNNSFLYARLGYESLNFHSISSNLEAWIGQSYMAGALTATVFLPTSTPVAYTFEAVASRRKFTESDKYFFRDNEPIFVVNHEYYAKTGFKMPMGRQGAFEVGIGFGHLYNTFYQNDSPLSYMTGRDHIALNLGQVYARYSSSTLDDLNFPTLGNSQDVNARFVGGKTHFYQAVRNLEHPGQRRLWGQVEWKTRNYFSLSRKFTLGVEGQILASTRKLFDDYYSSISSAPSYTPTPASANAFNPQLRANSFVAAGLVPVYKFNSSLSARLSANAFVPVRKFVHLPGGAVRYGNWFGSTDVFTELDVVYRFPFASVALYGNYSTCPGAKFNFGITFGMYLPAPKFL